LLLALALLVIFGVELALELALGGYPLSRLAFFDVAAARHFNNLLNRHLNQLVGIVFTNVAIAVPLTANLYSLKFLEFFVKDRVNAAVLLFVVFANVMNTWAGYALKEDVIPVVQLHLGFGLTVLCFALLFPYLYYVFRFLHPHTLLARLEHEFLDDLSAARRGLARAAYRKQAAEAIEYIANIAMRSVDRGDRNTAIESIFTLERMMRAYWADKALLPPAWFEAEQNFFLGFSSAAVEELTESRSWVEMKLFGELRQAVGAAVPRMPELVSTAAKTLRKLGTEPMARQDEALRDLVIAHFNTILRLALNRKDPRSVFIIFDQYRLYADAFYREHPNVALEIAYYFRYYGRVARDLQLPFVVEAVAHDLGTLVRDAWQANAPNRQQMLEDFLRYDSAAPHPLAGVKKAHAILASYFLLTGQPEPAAFIRTSFAALDPVFVHLLAEDLLHVTREKYWEVNERRMNIDYVPDAQRIHLREFLESVTVA
jgi:hypothetical protein